MSKAKFLAIFLGINLLAIPSIAGADYLGQEVNFFIDPSYDLYGREELSATLIKITNQLYFYADSNWWEKLDLAKKTEIDNQLYNLASEFEYKIYPTLTSNFGSEPKPGIDKDERITILIHPMISAAGGYFNLGDVYSKFQNPKSNQREMIYLNSQHIDKPTAKSFLAHEFTHLITLNQKDLLRNVSEEIWLNEARAEYAPTLLGYDEIYKGSNLERRVKEFLEKPSDSLTEWLNKGPDYGIVNLFTQYLVDHYGIKILRDSLQSSKTGIASINYALEKNGFKEDFSQIFTDWTIAVLVNDCSLGEKYCYKNPNLKNLKIVPESNFLPMATEMSLSVYGRIKDWSAKWQRIFGGKGNLTFTFNGDSQAKFKVPYILCDNTEKCEIKFFDLNQNQKGEIVIYDFGSKYSSLTIIPSVQQKLSGFSDNEPTFTFSWDAKTKELSKENPELIKKLLEQISYLKSEIAKVQAQINTILTSRQKIGTCTFFSNDLYFGMMGNPEVRCLQEFLKSQGPEIYPEGKITGNFLSLTKLAVIRFQEKYASEILLPLGLKNGTGYVGVMTRNKINQLLGRSY